MKNKKVLIILTIAVILTACAMIIFIDISRLSAYGSILAASGSFTAVIWFTGSLRYQAQQLKEQREQFQQEFARTHEEGRRNSLLLAKEILFTAEKRALDSNEELSSIEQIFSKYIDFSEFKVIYESVDPKEVQKAVNSWMKKEAPAIALMEGIKSAAQVYFIAIGKNDVDYSIEPEEFVSIYGCHLWQVPFFSSYKNSAVSLAEYMFNLQPGRKGVSLASLGAIATLTNKEILKMDDIHKDIAKYESSGRKIPQMAEILRD